MTQERLEHRRPQHHHPLPSAAGGRHLCHPTTPHRSHVVRPHVDDALHTHKQLVQERSGAASVAAAHARARVCHFQATQVQPQLHARTCGAPETVPATWVFPTPATARHRRTHSQRAHGPQLRAGGTHPNTARARTRKPATPQLRHTARHTTHNRRCAPHNAPSTTAVRQRTPARRAAENRRGATHTHPRQEGWCVHVLSLRPNSLSEPGFAASGVRSIHFESSHPGCGEPPNSAHHQISSV